MSAKRRDDEDSSRTGKKVGGGRLDWPEKDYPGALGRAEWFRERLGCRSGAASLGRLTAALDQGRAIPSPEERRAGVVEEGIGRLARAGLEMPDGPFLSEPGRKELSTLKWASPEGDQGIAAASPVVQVEDLRADRALLYLPLEPAEGPSLDLATAALVAMDPPAHPMLVEAAGVWHERKLLIGEITRPGKYQAWAYPRDRWLRTAFDTLCLYWPWILHEPRLRDRLDRRRVREIPGMVDRICQLILCAPEYGMLEDRRILDEIGLGAPMGDVGMPGAGGDVCKQCLGEFVGDLVVEDGLVREPPVIKFCRPRRRACSRWESVGPFPDEDFWGIGRVTQIVVHPDDGDVVLAAAAGGGVWRTTNRGTSWRPLMDEEPTLTMGGVAYAPSNPSVIYAASGEDAGQYNPAWPGVGVYRSTDGGASWLPVGGVPSTRFSAVVVDPTDPDVVYVAGNTGLHKSRDGGQTWLTAAGSNSLFDGPVTDVVIAHDDSDRVYIGVRNDGVYRSTTGGEAAGASPGFQRLDDADQLPSGVAAAWPKLAIGRDGTNGSDFLAVKLGANGSRIFSTTDAGDSWTELASNVATVGFDEWCSVIAVDPEDEDVLYAGAAGTLQRTDNGGASAGDWSSIGGVHPDQQDIAFDPADSEKLYLANDGGIFRSDDKGENWELASGNLRITQFYDIDISEKDPDIVGGGAQDNGVFYRTGAGDWRMPNFGWDGTQLAIDPTDPEILYFSSQSGIGNSIRKSTDGGQTHAEIDKTGLTGGSPWVTVIKLDPTDPIADPEDNRVVFVGGTNQLFRSTDGAGAGGWQRVEDAAGNPFTTNGAINALEFAPSDPQVLYLGTTTGAVYRGDNGGADAGDWTRLDNAGGAAAMFPNVPIQGIAVDAGDPDRVWVTFTGQGVTYSGRPNAVLNPLGISHVFRSEDGGQDWVDASGAFPGLSLPDVPTSAVALDDRDVNTAFVGTDIGVFRTSDGGATWSEFNDGLPRSPVMELRFGRTYRRLYAGTMGRGVYVRRL